MDKTPLGVTPRNIWINSRIVSLREAIVRYASAGVRIPQEWVDEYNSLVTDLTPER